MSKKLKNAECPYCGSHKTVSGHILTGAVGGVLCFIGIFFLPLVILGLLLVIVAIVMAIRESIVSKKKFLYCQDCKKTWTEKSEQKDEKIPEKESANTYKSGEKSIKDSAIKWQWFLSISLIIFGIIIVWGTVFWWLLNIICWIILIPNILKKLPIYSKITKKSFYFIVVFLFVIGIIFAVSSSNNHIDQNTAPNKTNLAHNDYVFDVPSLIWKNINELRKSFWKDFSDSTDPTSLQLKWTSEWSNTITKSWLDLLITYNAKTRKIIDFFLDWDEKYKIMQIWNLSDSDNNYSIEDVHALVDPSKITGIKIIPKQ